MSMTVLQAIILGIVQGLGEFLPISSTAHLVLAPYFFGWSDPGLAFDVALHLGTLVAVMAYFGKDWLDIFKLAFGKKEKQETSNGIYGKNILQLLILATIPGILAGYFWEEKAETVLRNPLLIAFALSFVGLVLFLADKYLKHKRNLSELNWKDSLLIGVSQAVAIVPGVSRSGATITAGIACGFSRVEAAKFSFLLSTPIIFGATVLKIKYLFLNFDLTMLIGIVVSAMSGYLAIKYLIRFVEKSSYAIFFWYRLVLAIIIILVHWVR